MDKFERQHHFEKEWIGSLIKDDSLYFDKTVNISHFHNQKNKKIYEIIQKCKNDGILLDFNTWKTLSDRQLNEIGGLSYIQECEKSCMKADIERFKYIEKEMKSFHIGQNIVQIAHDISKKEIYDLEECRAAIQEMTEVSEGVSNKRKNIKQLLKESHDLFMQLSENEGLSGVATGYQSLDAAFDGWQEKDLILVGARPSMGG